MRVLYIAGEVAPFSKTTDAAQFVREVPEQLQESGDYETRIIMPRYGTVSERRNRLHEVIRLSGTEITIGERTETLKVKVASIPGIRLQVYFMDNAHYFKRKGLFQDRKTEALFEDNAERALFFARAALATVENLGWAPDVVHATGWIAGLVPHVLKHELSERELFADVKCVYTPDEAEVSVPLPEALAAALGLEADAGKELITLGREHADVVATFGTAVEPNATDLTGDLDVMVEQTRALYQRVTGIDVAA